jgi:hypothetical protein
LVMELLGHRALRQIASTGWPPFYSLVAALGKSVTPHAEPQAAAAIHAVCRGVPMQHW